MSKLSIKEQIFAVVILIILTFAIGWRSFIPKDTSEHENELSEMLSVDGTPVMILQSRVGDDVTPIIHQTWCQILPYKRNIADDQIFCYIEVIDDWVVE